MYSSFVEALGVLWLKAMYRRPLDAAESPRSGDFGHPFRDGTPVPIARAEE
jgi:hypothetical protein